ncbi:MAG: ThiF family adenylyltransferase [Planctomycetota bacterium]
MNSTSTDDIKIKHELLIDDEDRYSRLRLIGWWDQKKISGASILVVGAGALGNEVLKNLALLGIGRVYVIDMDHVDKTNLTRSILFRAGDEGKPKSEVACAMMNEVNPDCSVIPITGNVITDIGLGLVRDIDLVIGCLDNREARLWVNRMCWKAGTPWIDGGIQEINGVAKVFVPPDGACYECAMTDNDYRLISLRYSCPLLKQEDILQGKVPTAPTIASIVGGLQVQEALKLIHDLPAAEGSALVFNGAANRFYQTDYPRREDCLSHESYEDIVELELSAGETTVSHLFDEVEKATGVSPVALTLDRDYLVKLTCRECSFVVDVNKPQQLVKAQDGICGKCSMPMHAGMISSIERGDELAEKTLAELGIPAYDIVKVETEDATTFVLLTGDRDAVCPPVNGAG